MEIQINNRAVDFELNNEKTINDVINWISEWTQQRDLIFTEARVNEKDYLPEDVPEIPLDDVKILNCQVQSRADVIISSLDSGLNYCLKVGEYLNKCVEENEIDKNEITNIVSGIDWLAEILKKTAQLLNIEYKDVFYQSNPVNDYIDKVINFKGIAHITRTSEITEYIKDKKNIFHSLAGIFRMILMSEDVKLLSIQSIDAPDVLMRSIYSLKDEIGNQIKNLEETAVAYQTGRDSDAAGKLNKFIDFIFHYSRTCLQASSVFSFDPDSITAGPDSLKNKNDRIENLLKDIIDAMENNDIISLSDVLEYEMKPLLEDLPAFIDVVIESLSKKN